MSELKTDPTPATETATRKPGPQTNGADAPVEQEIQPHTRAHAVIVRPPRRSPLRMGLQTGLRAGLAR